MNISLLPPPPPPPPPPNILAASVSVQVQDDETHIEKSSPMTHNIPESKGQLYMLLFGASLSEPRIHEEQEAVLYVYIYVCIYTCMYVCGVIISVRKELN